MALGAMCAAFWLAPAAEALVWSPPVVVTRSPDASRFALAVNTRGEQVVVWEETRQVSPPPRYRARTTVRARVRAPGGRFRPVQRLRRSTAAILPDIAIARDGTAIAAWNRVFRGHYRIFAAVRRPGRRFGRPVQIGRTDKAQGAAPQVEFDHRGNAIVLWRWSDRLQWAYRARGHGFRTARTIRVGKAALRVPAQEKFLTFDRRGNAYVALASRGRQRRTAGGDVTTIVEGGVFLATRRPGGRFGRPRRVSPAGVPASRPEAAVSPDGTIVVVWRAAPTPGTEDMWGPIRALTIGADGTRTLRTLSADRPGAGTDPHVQFTRAGTAVAVWRQGHVDPPAGQFGWVEVAASVGAGGAFGAPVVLSPAGVETERGFVAATDRDDAVVTWEQLVGGRNAVVALTRDPSGGLSPAQELAVAPSSAVVHADGHVVVLLRTEAGPRLVNGR